MAFWFNGKGAEEAQAVQCLEFFITTKYKQEKREAGDEPNLSILFY